MCHTFFMPRERFRSNSRSLFRLRVLERSLTQPPDSLNDSPNSEGREYGAFANPYQLVHSNRDNTAEINTSDQSISCFMVPNRMPVTWLKVITKPSPGKYNNFGLTSTYTPTPSVIAPIIVTTHCNR